MNNNIPFPFAAQTEIHDELVTYALPPLSQKIYSWLLRRCKPGVEQEFDKADFDKFCQTCHRKPFSIQWFMTCFKKLINIRLVKLVRKYYGYGFKVVVFHPWELDDWLVNDKSSNTKKTWNNSKLKFKYDTSNADSPVPSYRDNKEITAIPNGSTESCVTNKRQNIAAQKKETQLKRSVSPITLKSSTSAKKSVQCSNPPKQELTAKESNSNHYSGDNKLIDGVRVATVQKTPLREQIECTN